MAHLQELQRTDFEPHLHRAGAFRLSGEGLPEPVALELVEARSLTKADPGLRRQPFGLVFRGPREPVLPQRIYRLDNPSTGPQDLFLVPIRRDDAGTYYEAIFT
jgi:hypothetical protein